MNNFNLRSITGIQETFQAASDGIASIGFAAPKKGNNDNAYPYNGF